MVCARVDADAGRPGLGHRSRRRRRRCRRRSRPASACGSGPSAGRSSGRSRASVWVPTVCSVPTGAARFSARAVAAYEVSAAGCRPANSWGTQAYSGTVRRWFQSPAKASAPLMVLASPRISMISSAQAVVRRRWAAGGRPGRRCRRPWSARGRRPSVSQGLVSRQSAGRRILSCRSAQARVASEMSFLTTVLSQSKAATGRGAVGVREQLPRSSIIFWSLARLWPYHLMLVESWGQVARAGAFAGGGGGGRGGRERREGGGPLPVPGRGRASGACSTQCVLRGEGRGARRDRHTVVPVPAWMSDFTFGSPPVPRRRDGRLRRG